MDIAWQKRPYATEQVETKSVPSTTTNIAAKKYFFNLTVGVPALEF